MFKYKGIKLIPTIYINICVCVCVCVCAHECVCVCVCVCNVHEKQYSLYAKIYS